MFTLKQLFCSEKVSVLIGVGEFAHFVRLVPFYGKINEQKKTTMSLAFYRFFVWYNIQQPLGLLAFVLERNN